MATHESSGKLSSIGTMNWRHPFQCPISIMRQMRLKIRTAATKNKIRLRVNPIITQKENLLEIHPFHKKKNTDSTAPEFYQWGQNYAREINAVGWNGHILKVQINLQMYTVS